MLNAKALDLQAAARPSESLQGLGLLSYGRRSQVQSSGQQQGNRREGRQPVKLLGELSKLVHLTELLYRLATISQMTTMVMMMNWRSGR